MKRPDLVLVIINLEPHHKLETFKIRYFIKMIY